LVLTGNEVSHELVERADLVTEVTTYPPENSAGENDHDFLHPTEVVTGNGKGKTTYCLGKAMLMSSMAIRTLILQFVKSPKAYGEVKAAEKLPHLEIKTMGEGFLNRQGAASNKKHVEAARRAWEECLKETFSLEYRLVVLDEINVATHYGLVNPERVREMLSMKPKKLHLILSGRNAHPEVARAASSVVEMREIKHPYKKGIKARRGIEF
jgi:cob(I)alamin adenosyltransferase